MWFPSVVYGVGSAFAFVPLLPLMQASVRNDGPKYADLANGLFVSCYFFGEMLGQLFGSSLVHELGYPAASTAWAFAIIASASGFVLVEFGAGLAKRLRSSVSRVRSMSDSLDSML